MSRWREHGYNFTYRNGTAILDDEDTDDVSYAPYDHKGGDDYPSLHHGDIIELDIAGLYDNINDDNYDNNTDDANTNVHEDSDINTTDNAYVPKSPNDANTEDEDTKYANTEYEDTK